MKYDRLSDSPRSQVQRAAVAAGISTLLDKDRARFTMACGTGKTFAELMLAEQATSAIPAPKRILVQVPTLDLVRQIRNEWAEQQDFGEGYGAICVCSDQQLKGKKPSRKTDSEDDEIRLSPQEMLELGIDPNASNGQEIQRVSDWISTREAANPNAVSVVFTTYSSIKTVGAAMRLHAKGSGAHHFDVAIFDEAHRTAGHLSKLDTFAYALDDTNLKIVKRAFFTATERVKGKRTGDEFLSMDDESVYGPLAYNISFREAAELGIIVPYKLIISVINDDNIKPEMLDTVAHDKDGKSIAARDLANMAALDRAMRSHDLKKAITFHSRVVDAEAFANARHSVDGATLSAFARLHVSGSQPASDRQMAMQTYATPGLLSIISNAKCLTEGVNVPETDLVAFVDPKSSKTDIIQAVGRALRKHEGKEAGYVFLPLHVSRHEKESYEQAFERSVGDFEQITDVLRALSSNDESLRDSIRNISRRNAEIDADVKAGRINEKEAGRQRQSLMVNLPIEIQSDIYPGEIDPDVIVRAVQSRVVEIAAESLEDRYRLFSWALKDFKTREGHCRVPTNHIENGLNLGSWVVNQRAGYRSGYLSKDRIDQLEALGFVWNIHQADFDRGLQALKAFKAREGHCRIHNNHIEDKLALGKWVGTQRTENSFGKLSKDRIDHLNEIGFVWDPFQEDFEKGIKKLQDFKSREGHCDVLKGHKEGELNLGNWFGTQRKAYNKGELSKDRIHQLKSLGFEWDPLSAKWNENMQALEKFHASEGHNRPPKGYKEDGLNISTWSTIQRRNYYNGKLSKERIAKLESIGFEWNPSQADYDQNIQALIEFKAREGHCRVLAEKNDGHSTLGGWVSDQRNNYRNGKLSKDRIKQLEAIGFEWNPAQADYDRNIYAFSAFKAREGHCRVPKGCVENGLNIGTWVVYQRMSYRKGNISKERLDQLDALGFVWNAKEEKPAPPSSHPQMHIFDAEKLRAAELTKRSGPYPGNDDDDGVEPPRSRIRE